MARPGYWNPKVNHNKAFSNVDSDSATDMGDLPVNVTDLNDECGCPMFMVDKDEVDIETMIEREVLIQDGVSRQPKAMFPDQMIRPNELNRKENNSYG